MRKFTLLLAIAAIAAAPSLAMAKTTKHHAKHAKSTKVAKVDPNANTYRLFAEMFAPSKAPAKKK
jgi:hypothetical protein